MLTFEKKGIENTTTTLQLALEEATKRDLDICMATTMGASAKQMMEMAKAANFQNKIVVVSHAYGFRTPGENTLSDELRKELEDHGITVVTASHVLSGAERGLGNKYQGVYPVQIIADSLRMLSQGVKVCVEIAVMALDAGKLPYGKEVLCIGGTGRGQDTICIVTPSHANHILDTKINEIIAKPYNP